MNEECCTKRMHFLCSKNGVVVLIHLKIAITCIVKYSFEFTAITYDSLVQLVLLPCLIVPWFPSTEPEKYGHI